jgi:eukaryotic-like serine/threonine-protein kinase
MRLAPGQRLGPYEIGAALGAGGMGEVYSATDSRLGRRVAIKVLPAHLSQEPDVRARFEREGMAIAALSHPNILAIHDVGTEGGVAYAVMELLDGETLRTRLKESPMSWRKAVSIALQVAEGLAAAHAKGVVHRDLKPENIFLTSAGQAKILDFGLARVSLTGVDNGTTIGPLTQPGMVMGTIGYMSPEQISGSDTDASTDIFAFGCVLYELLAGVAPFLRATPADTMAAALRDEPAPLADLVKDVPAALEAIVVHCLEKRAADRFQSARDMAFALRAVAGSTSASSVLPPTSTLGLPPRAPSRRARMVAGVAAGLIACVAFGWWLSRLTAPAPAAAELVRLSVALSSGGPLASNDSPAAGSSIAISRDGRWIAYVVFRSGARRLVLRSLDRFEEKELQGTDGAMTPIFSPDAQWLAFFTEAGLSKVPVGGGTPTTIAVTPPVARGAVWADDGKIYVSQDFCGGLSAISSAGGQPTAVTSVDFKAGESNHLLPEALPGSKALLFTVWKGGDFGAASIWSVSLPSGARKQLLESAAAPHYVAPGFLVFSRAGALFAVRFDPEGLAVSGEAVPVVDAVWTDRGTGTAHYAVSGNGTLVYAPGGNAVELRRLVSVDRQGRAEVLPADPNFYGNPRVSPDGRRVAVEALNDVWVFNFADRTIDKVTSRGVNLFPVWAPDGRHLTFTSSVGGGGPTLHWTNVDAAGTQPEQLASGPGIPFPGSWTRERGADTLAYAQAEGTGAPWNIWLLRPGNPPTKNVLLRTPFNVDQPMFSPDGRAMAYVSDETTRREVYVRSFPDTGRRQRVSADGGTEPVWSHRSNELFYRNGRQYYSVPITPGDPTNAGRPTLLFEGDFVVAAVVPGAPSYGVASDNDHFIMVARVGDAPRPLRLDVVLGWPQDLERRLRPAGAR